MRKLRQSLSVVIIYHELKSFQTRTEKELCFQSGQKTCRSPMCASTKKERMRNEPGCNNPRGRRLEWMNATARKSTACEPAARESRESTMSHSESQGVS